MNKKKIIALVVLWLVLFAVIYVRPLPLEDIMPGIFDAPITACEAKFCTVEAGEDSKPVYKDVTKRFAPDSDECAELLRLLQDGKYRLQLASAFYGGHRPPEKQPCPRAEIRFTQGDAVYEVCAYTKYFVMGPVGALRDVDPAEEEAATSAVMEFVRDHGEVVSVDVRDYANQG